MENSNNKFDKKKVKKSDKEKVKPEVENTNEEQTKSDTNEDKDSFENKPLNHIKSTEDPNTDKYFSEKKFSDMNLTDETVNSLTESGFDTATEIQAKCIPMAMEGMDIIGSAKTGSGKSLAFLIPSVEILARSEDKESKSTRVLVLTPTRELALQLFNLSRDLLRFHEQHSCALIMGGANRKVEAEKLRRGVSLIIATPGRLLDHLVNTKGFDYSKISLLVIDEADDILKIGFEKELKEIISLIPKNRQTMLFSATLSPKVEDIITLSMKNYQFIGIKSKEATVSTLEQGYVVVEPDKKFRFLYSFIRKNLNKKIMVFFSTIKAVEFYSALLNYVDIPCKAIHGEQKQQKRSTTYLEFCGLEKGILLCTDVAQRGLDFPDVDWVIQYDPPHDPQEYLHRVGRTARGANKKGKALLVLIPCEIGMVRYLKSYKIGINEFDFDDSKLCNIQEQLEKLVNKKDHFLLTSATDAYRSFLHAYVSHTLKDVYDINNLDLAKLCKSFGLASPPFVNLNLKILPSSQRRKKMKDSKSFYSKSTMENLEVSHDVNKKNEAIQDNQSKSFCNETIINNQNDAEALLKNLNDLSSNDLHLKRKRESEIPLLTREKILTNNHEEVANLNFHQTCQLCKIEDPIKKLINCKICHRVFHMDCFKKVGKFSIDNQPMCNECGQKEISNRNNNQNASNYYNNFNAMNSNFQINNQNYPQNLNMLNEMLKNNINRNMTMIPLNTLNNAPNANQNKLNYVSGSYPTNQHINHMSSNMMNTSNLPNSQNFASLLQSGQIPLSQMNPQQLIILSHMLKNEKTDVNNLLGNTGTNLNSINSMLIQNQRMMNQIPTTNPTYGVNNMNTNQDAIRNSLLNQLILNINKSKINNGGIPSSNPTIQNFNNNIYPNLLDSSSYNLTKNTPNNQQMHSEQQHIPTQSSLFNLVNKQNNITNLNFFNNLFNISQIQNSNSNTFNPNPNYLNEKDMNNLMPNKNTKNIINPINYLTANYQNSKTQNIKLNPSNNLEFVGANTYLKNLISNTGSNIQNYKRDVKKIPIDDSLLLNDPEKYEINHKCFERPEPKPLEIPQTLENKVFIIWDFFHTFRKTLDPEDHFFANNEISIDIEEFFNNILTEEIFLKLVMSLLTLFVIYSYGSDPTEFEIEKGLLLLRTIKENINTNLNTITKNCWKEIFKLITESKKFSLLLNNEINKIIKTIKNLSYQEESNYQFSTDDKISILFYLVNSTMEINRIKDIIKSEFEKKNNLFREKVSLKIEYKNKDHRKKEIEKSDKFLKAPHMIEELNKKLQELEENNPIANKILNKQKKEIEIERERYKSILKENIEIERVKDNIIERRTKIKRQLHEMNINNKRLIGVDAYHSEYYFFINVPNRIFVKKIVCPSKDEINLENENSRKAKETKWFYYDDKDTINEFLNKLLEKGLKEKKLKNKLKKILVKKMIFDIKAIENESKSDNYKEKNNELEVEQEKMSEQIIKVNDEEMINIVNEVNQEKYELTLAVEIIKKMDEKFSEYLTQYSKEWEEKELRSKWRDTITNYPTLSNLISSIAMFNIRFKNPYRNDEPPLSDDDVEEKEKYKQKFQFRDSNENILFEIKAFDIAKLLAPKVKIWSKDLETYEMERYYNESIIPFINNISKLYLSLHFFESIIFNLIKRRENLSKKNINLLREITDGNYVIINEIENMDLTEDNHVKDTENVVKNIINDKNQIENDDKTLSYYPDNEKTETIMINQSENNSEKKNKRKEDELEGNQTNTKREKANFDKKESQNKIHIKKRKYSNINTGINLLKKRKRNATPKDLTMTEWRDTCYICLEYGDLVCCDGCTNAAHLFCAYLDKLPVDWYCEICCDKMKKNKKQK